MATGKAASENLLVQTKADSYDQPAWFDFCQHSRLAACRRRRNLPRPENLKMALAWNKQAAAMTPGVFTPFLPACSSRSPQPLISRPATSTTAALHVCGQRTEGSPAPAGPGCHVSAYGLLSPVAYG